MPAKKKPARRKGAKKGTAESKKTSNGAKRGKVAPSSAGSDTAVEPARAGSASASARLGGALAAARMKLSDTLKSATTDTTESKAAFSPSSRGKKKRDDTKETTVVDIRPASVPISRATSSQQARTTSSQGRGASKTPTPKQGGATPQSVQSSGGASSPDDEDESDALGARLRRWCLYNKLQLKAYLRTLMYQGHEGAVTAVLATDAEYRRAGHTTVQRHGKAGRAHWIFTGGHDGDVRKYAIETLQCDGLYEGTGSPVSLMVTRKSDGRGRRRFLYVIAVDGVISKFDAVSEMLLLRQDTHRGRICSAILYQDTLYTGSDSGPVMLLSAKTCKRERTISGHVGAVTGLAVGKSGVGSHASVLYSASADATVRITDLGSGNTTRMIKIGVPVAKIEMSKDGTMVCICKDGKIRLVDTAGSTTAAVVDPGVGPITSMQLCGSNFLYLSTASSKGIEEPKLQRGDGFSKGVLRVVAVKIASNTVAQRYHGHGGVVHDFQVCDNRFIVTVSEDASCHVYRLGTGMHVGTIRSFPVYFVSGVIQMFVSWSQLMSIPLVWTRFGEAFSMLRLDILSSPDMSPAAEFLHTRMVLILLLMIAFLAIIVPDRVKYCKKRASQAAKREGVDSKNAVKWRRLRSAGWLVVWAASTVLMLPICDVCFAVLGCQTDASGREVMLTAPSLECGSVFHVMYAALGFFAVMLFAPIAVRLGRVDGKSEYLSRVNKPVRPPVTFWKRVRASHWTNWNGDHSRLKSDAMAKVDTAFDTWLAFGKVCLSFLIALYGEASLPVAVMFMLLVLALLVTFTLRQTYARPGVSHIYGGLLWVVVMASICAVVAASESNSEAAVVGDADANAFPLAAFLLLLPPCAAFGTAVDWLLRASKWGIGGKRDCVTPAFEKLSACGARTASSAANVARRARTSDEVEEMAVTAWEDDVSESKPAVPKIGKVRPHASTRAVGTLAMVGAGVGAGGAGVAARNGSCPGCCSRLFEAMG